MTQTSDRVRSRPAVALTIAGSDSGGGAGIQADLKTFQAFGVFGTSAVTAITAQNTMRVAAVHTVPLEVVRAQIDTVVDDLEPVATKTGMLATAELVVGIARAIKHHRLDHFVLDPVMVATSGDRLLTKDAEEALVRELLPQAELITPNLHEARILTGRDIATPADMSWAARELVRMGARAALVKGGHLSGDRVLDVLWDGGAERTWNRPRLSTSNTHGTGCTLSAGVTANLALGMPLREAVEGAVDFVAHAIATAPDLGHGHGPINHAIGSKRTT